MKKCAAQIRQLYSVQLSFSSTVSSDAVILVAEMLKVFVEEATRRAVKQAGSEDCDTVDIEHFEKILPQLATCALLSGRCFQHALLRSPIKAS
ncbi:Centromere protein X [Anabarilius grahami]|uniref:Centromere protein X n=1 Tax=Anabarilius grahami TaxID=495550 RepID=A0A3N0YHS6_ANAGA|nr:Centromere protein X [Anabarilius grahami]